MTAGIGPIGPASAMRNLRVQAGGGSGVVATGRSAGAGGPGNFTDHSGPVIASLHLQLVFWGGAWRGGASPGVGDVEAAARLLVTGGYLAGLAEYRGIGPGRLLPSVLATETEPPARFGDADVVGLLKGLLEARRVAEPDDDRQLLCCIVMPPGVSYQNANVIGEHSYFLYFDLDLNPLDVDLGIPCHYAWVTNDGTLDGITTVLSHELAESVTDPQGTGVQADPGVCGGDGWCEIGDVCEGQTGTCDGVAVQAFWSQRAGACVVPASATLVPVPPVPVSAPGPPDVAASADHRLSPEVIVEDVAAAAAALRAALPTIRPGERGVELSFVLGWHVAELFLLAGAAPPAMVAAPDAAAPAAADPAPPGPAPAPAAVQPLTMTSVDGLQPDDRLSLLLAQIGNDLASMRQAGVVYLPPPPLTGGGPPAIGGTDHQAAVADWDRPVLAALTAANYKFGKAYSLGRQLCTFSGQPTDAQTIAMLANAEVVARTCAWLADLKSSFASCATDATQLTLKSWGRWASGCAGTPPPDLQSQMNRQGAVWRSLLSGEKHAPDLLHPGHYLAAGERLVVQYARLGWRFLGAFRWPLLASIVLVVALLVAAAVLALTPALAAATASLLGLVGLAGAGTMSAVKRVLSVAERPIWEAEITQAVVLAASHAPQLPPAEQAALWSEWWDGPGPAGPVRRR